jgi:hypothetical protein
MASETISMGGLELRFLQTKEETAGSLDAFEMTVQPNARMPSRIITRAGTKRFTG